MHRAAHSKSTLIINETTLKTGIHLKERGAIYTNNLWHKVCVQNATKYSREFVLRTLMDALHPLDFIPICYSIEDDCASFLLKNCGSAIDRMCMLNLTVPHPEEHKNLPPFKLTIYLKHAYASEMKIDIQNNLSKVIQKRYNSQTKTLNLEYFLKDPDLTEFCPLSQPKLLYFVLHLSKEFDFEHLRLVGNEITTLQPFESLQGFKASKSLAVLDIRKNNIEKESDLAIMKHFSVSEILLSENPLCEKLSEGEYIKVVKGFCPHLKKLDNVTLPIVGEVPTKRNYLCDPQGGNFVNQFLEHYFTLYDSFNRETLMNMYHKDALLSITTHYSGTTSSDATKIFLYKKFCRNLMSKSDMSKSYEYLVQGSANIGNMFKIFPETEHDPYTFTVDLMQFTDKCRTFTISGVFKEPGQSLLQREYFYSFMRTFVLTPVSDCEFCIVNDMLHITNASSTQQATAFKVVKVPCSQSLHIPDAKTQAEMNDMVRALVSLTNLLPEWAIKCLKEVNYNFKNALILFTDLFRANKLPAAAFDFNDFKSHIQSVVTTPMQIQQIEAIKAHSQPYEPDFHKVQPKPTAKPVKRTPTPKRTSPAHKSQAKSRNPPKSTPQPPVVSAPTKNTDTKATKTKGESKHSDKQPTRILQQIVISPQGASKTSHVTPTPPSSSVKPGKPVEELAAASPNTLVAATKNPAKSITINLQKNRQDSFDAIDTDVGDFKQYVKDEIVIKALSMPPDTPISTVKRTLDDACKQVMNKYTFGLKYYKAMGREFYRYNLHSEARIFLANAMAIVPKKMGEQLYSLFTLFEVQFGDANVATNMMFVIAETFATSNAAVFMSQHLPKTNAAFARKVFDMIPTTDVDIEKKKTLLKSYVEFETVYGNVENLRHAKKVYEDIMRHSGTETKVEQKKDEDLASIDGIPVSSKQVPAQNQQNEPPSTKENEKSVAEEKQSKVEERDKKVADETVIVIEDEKNDNKPTGHQEIQDTDKNESFEEFRDKLLQAAKIMPEENTNDDVKAFAKLTDKQSIEQQGEKLLTKYYKDFYVIRLVLKKWKVCGNSMKIAKTMPSIKSAFPFDSKIVNPLILYLKVRDDMMNRDFVAAKNKLLTHIKISHYIDIIQVFEDLMADAETYPEFNTFLDSVLKEMIVDKTQVTMAKVKLLMIIYMTFCKRTKSTNSDDMFNKHFAKDMFFHPDDILENEEIRTRRSAYEKKTPQMIKNEYRVNYAQSRDTIESKIEEMRMLYFIGDANTARFRRNAFTDKNEENVKRFTLACSYYEAIYGTPMVGMKHLRRAYDDSISYHCVAMMLNFQIKTNPPLKLQIKQLFCDIFRISNPHVQETLYKYHKDWIKLGFNIFDKSWQE